MSILETRIDQFHTLCAVLSRVRDLPYVARSDLSGDEKIHFMEVAADELGEYLIGSAVLPENRPATRTGEIHWARACEAKHGRYVFLFRLIAEYRGGAATDEVMTKGEHRFLKSDRLYYNARLMPVSAITAGTAGQVLDFVVERLPEVQALFTPKEASRGWYRGSAFFDEPDYGPLNEKFSKLFDFCDAWQCGALLRPFLVQDYLTLTLNLVAPTPELIDAVLPFFDRSWKLLRDGQSPATLSGEDQDFWCGYYRSFNLERVISRSGNPQWRLNQFYNPDAPSGPTGRV